MLGGSVNVMRSRQPPDQEPHVPTGMNVVSPWLQVARVYRVPPHIVRISDNVTVAAYVVGVPPGGE